MSNTKIKKIQPGTKVELNRQGFDFIKDEVVQVLDEGAICRNTGFWFYEDLKVL